MTKFRKGEAVTSAKGWHGRIDRIAPATAPHTNTLYWVHWKERAEHAEKLVAKFPIIPHTEEQIWRPVLSDNTMDVNLSSVAADEAGNQSAPTAASASKDRRKTSAPVRRSAGTEVPPPRACAGTGRGRGAAQPAMDT